MSCMVIQCNVNELLVICTKYWQKGIQYFHNSASKGRNGGNKLNLHFNLHQVITVPTSMMFCTSNLPVCVS